MFKEDFIKNLPNSNVLHVNLTGNLILTPQHELFRTSYNEKLITPSHKSSPYFATYVGSVLQGLGSFTHEGGRAYPNDAFQNLLNTIRMQVPAIEIAVEPTSIPYLLPYH